MDLHDGTLLHLVWLGLLPRNPAALAGVGSGSGRAAGARSRPASSRSWYGSPLLSYDAGALMTLSTTCSANSSRTAAGTALRAVDRGKYSSFHTSVLALEALDAYQRAGGGAATDQAQARGREFSCGISSASPITQPGGNPWQYALAAPVALRHSARA